MATENVVVIRFTEPSKAYQALSVLKEAGLVDERRNGTQRLYRARPQGLADLKAFLDAFWNERLEALQHDAEREEREERQHGKRD